MRPTFFSSSSSGTAFRKLPKHPSNTSVFIFCTAMGHRTDIHDVNSRERISAWPSGRACRKAKKATITGASGIRWRRGVNHVFRCRWSVLFVELATQIE